VYGDATVYVAGRKAIGQKADARSGVWSLGVTYTKSLTGVTPSGERATWRFRAITDEPVPAAARSAGGYAGAGGADCGAALEKDPELRYQHARDLATDRAGDAGSGAGVGEAAADRDDGMEGLGFAVSGGEMGLVLWGSILGVCWRWRRWRFC